MNKRKLVPFFQEITRKVNASADKTGQKVEEFIQNEEVLLPVLRAAYTRLPLFFRVVIKEERFVNFLLANKEKLLVHRQVELVVSEIVSKFMR